MRFIIHIKIARRTKVNDYAMDIIDCHYYNSFDL